MSANRSSDLANAVSNFLALRLARPELASVAWFGGIERPSPGIPLRRLLRIGSTTQTAPIDLIADLDALPFRDHQFQGVVLDASHISVTSVQQAEQLYRVLHERALLIVISGNEPHDQVIRPNDFFGLFRQRQQIGQGVFCKRYGRWPMTPPASYQKWTDLLLSAPAWLSVGPRVEIFDKVTPPPPLPGLTTPITSRITSGMPMGSLAQTPATRLGLTNKAKSPRSNGAKA